jgi:hypothetical protein
MTKFVAKLRIIVKTYVDTVDYTILVQEIEISPNVW